MNTNLEFQFEYDIKSWILDNNNKSLNHFRFDKKRTISFQFDADDSRVIQDELDRQNTDIGRSQALKRLPLQIQWRHSKIIN